MGIFAHTAEGKRPIEGSNQDLREEIKILKQQIEELDSRIDGMIPASNITMANDVTESGFVADARQMNPSVPGSMSEKVENILKYPRIRQIVKIAVLSEGAIQSNQYKNVNVDISQYGFVKTPIVFLGRLGWLSVHSVNATTTNMRVTLLNPYTGTWDDGVEIVLMELL